MNLQALLKPRKVAVVGASEKEGFGGDTCRNMIAYMDPEDYFFVNPKRSRIFGKPCYPSISQLPEPAELLVICTPANTVEELLCEGAAQGAKAAVVFASGYGETGMQAGRNRETCLTELCQELDLTLMGPNCAGFANYVDRVHPFAFLSQERDRKGSVGVVSQSGQLVLTMMDRPGMKFSYCISAGNSKLVSMEDYLDFLVEDRNTDVIAMYLEGVGNPSRFVDALKKAALRRKPVVILKTGRSEKARVLAASHTGSLSGADRIFDALFAKFGVIRVNDLEELMATAMALAVLKKYPEGKGLAGISLSGGETGICADLAHLNGLGYSELQSETLAALKDILPGYATPNNPLDATATLSYDTQAFAKVLEIIMKDPGIDLVFLGYTLLTEIADNAIEYMSAAMEQVSRQPWCKPMVMVPFAEMTRNPEYANRLADMGIPVLPTAQYAFPVIKNIMEMGAYRAEDHNLDVCLPNFEVWGRCQAKQLGRGAQSCETEQPDEREQICQAEQSGEVEQICQAKQPGEERPGATLLNINLRNPLSESQSKDILKAAGIPCGRYVSAATEQEAVAAFQAFGSVPAAVKIDSPDILHKTEAGCVKLNRKTEEDVRQSFSDIMKNAKAYKPEARILGALICEMAPPGVEVMIGVNMDPQFGPCVLCGMGGVMVEILQDTALGLAPLSRLEAETMLRSLKGAALLEGFRGSVPCDKEALVQALIEVSHLACEQKEKLLELDLNPVFVYEHGICAVDALYVQRKGGG